MVEKLAALGMPLDLGEIRRVVGAGAFGRPHIARAMVAKGYVKTFDEAFDRWLAHGKPGYVPKPKWTLEEAIAAIRAAGGLSVIAHPVWYANPARVVATGVAAGLDGLEVFHVDQSGRENEFGALADRHGLLKSAGSDYHGPPENGKRVGSCRLDAAGWERMVAAAHARRAASGRPPLDLSPR
jgi:predicted metal-dependent phosphoesterase TrpH